LTNYGVSTEGTAVRMQGGRGFALINYGVSIRERGSTDVGGCGFALTNYGVSTRGAAVRMQAVVGSR